MLNEELGEIRLEFESGYGSIKQKNVELQQFTEKLSENIKNSNHEREQLKRVFTEITEGKDFDKAFKEIEEKYIEEISKFKENIAELSKENSQLLAENKILQENFIQNVENEESFDLQKNEEVASPRLSWKTDEELKRIIEKLEKREKEIEELKLQLVIENQAKDTVDIEKRSIHNNRKRTWIHKTQIWRKIHWIPFGHPRNRQFNWVNRVLKIWNNPIELWFSRKEK